MTDALVVHLNRSTHHAIEPTSDSFETTGPFVVRVQNHGEGSHVHCSLSGDLASTATVTDGNPFLEPDDVVEIPVDVGTDLRPARGTLELSTGYGREAVEIDVLVRESSDVPTSPIEPDRKSESDTGRPAAAPADRARETSGTLPGLMSDVTDRLRDAAPRRDLDTTLLLAVAALAVLVAFGAAQLFESALVTVAVVVVLATVVGATAALLRD